jgi:hypothetical protein
MFRDATMDAPSSRPDLLMAFLCRGATPGTRT